MRTLLIFILFLSFTIISGALLAYPVYTLIQAIFTEGSYMANSPFGKVANRCFMITAAIGLYPTWKAFHCNREDLGLNIKRQEFFKEVGRGALFGFASLLVLNFSTPLSF